MTNEYLQIAVEIGDKVRNEGSNYHSKMKEQAEKIYDLVGLAHEKLDILNSIDRCLTELILPELERRMSYEVSSNAFLNNFKTLADYELDNKKLFAEHIKPYNLEMPLPAAFIKLLEKEPFPTEAIREVPTWESLKNETLQLPEKMTEVYTLQVNPCSKKQELIRVAELLMKARAELEEENQISHKLNEQAAQMRQEITENLSKARASTQTLDVEKSEVNDLKNNLTDLMQQKQSLDLLNRQTRDMIIDLENSIANTKSQSKQVADDLDTQIRQKVKEMSHIQTVKHEKDSQGANMQVEIEQLEKENAKINANIALNKEKWSEKERLKEKLELLESVNTNLKLDIEKLAN